MKAFRSAIPLAEFEASDAKLIKKPFKFCKAEDHTRGICGVKHPERRGKKMLLKHQQLKSVTEMSSRFNEYLKSTKNADELKLAKLRHIKDDDFKDN